VAIPDYQALMLPMLELCADGNEHQINDLVEALSGRFELTVDERDQRLSSGQRVIYNRTHWAATYLTKARVLERSGRGRLRITSRGLDILGTKPAQVNVKLLSGFPEFEAFRKAAAAVAPNPVPTTSVDPEELLDTTYRGLRSTSRPTSSITSSRVLPHSSSSSSSSFSWRWDMAAQILSKQPDTSGNQATTGSMVSLTRTSSAWTPCTSRRSDGRQTIRCDDQISKPLPAASKANERRKVYSSRHRASQPTHRSTRSALADASSSSMAQNYPV